MMRLAAANQLSEYHTRQLHVQVYMYVCSCMYVCMYVCTYTHVIMLLYIKGDFLVVMLDWPSAA